MQTEVHGLCEPTFAPMREAFAANFAAGDELGASLCLTHHGRTVVDLWAGFTDRKRTRPWERDTIVLVFSTTKIMATLCALIAIDRGLLALEQPVARYWPEFAAGGKEAVTVRDALTFQGGVPGFNPAIGFDILYDWEAAVGNIATQAHWFGGERTFCYHPHTYGFLLGELIRRVDGRKTGRFFADEVAAKAGLDFHIGLTSEAQFARLAQLSFPPTPMVFPDSLYARVFESVPPGDWMARETLSADIAASNGCGNGRAIARTCATLAMGGTLDGVSYLSRGLVEEAVKEQVYVEDEYMGWISMGLGLGLNSPGFPLPTPTAAHWGGYGGSWGVFDPRLELSLGYAPNNMLWSGDGFNDPRHNRFIVALDEILPTL